MNAQNAADYPQLFRDMIIRSAEAALASIDPQASTLEEDVRERSLYALSLALDLPDAWPVTRDLLLTLTTSLHWQGYREEWIVYLNRAIGDAETQEDFPALAKLYHQLGWFYRALNVWQQANECLQRAYELSRRVDGVDIKIDVLDQLSGVAVESHDFAAAKQYIDEVFALTEAGDLRRAKSYGRLGYIALHQGDYENSIFYYAESIRLHSAAGNLLMAAQVEEGLAFVYEYSQRPEEALRHFQHVIEVLAQYPSVLDLAQTQMEMGLVHVRLHNFEEALELFRLSEPVFIKTGSRLWLAHLYNNYGIAYTEKGDYEQAQHFFAIGIQAARELDMPLWIANVMDSQASMFAKMGRIDDAVATWRQALAELSVLPDPPQRLYNLIASRIAQASSVRGNPLLDSPGQVGV